MTFGSIFKDGYWKNGELIKKNSSYRVSKDGKAKIINKFYSLPNNLQKITHTLNKDTQR